MDCEANWQSKFGQATSIKQSDDKQWPREHYLYKGRKIVPKDPLQHPLGRPRAMSRHAPYSTSHTITLTGIAVHSVMHKGVQTAYACARAFKSTICWRETAVER